MEYERYQMRENDGLQDVWYCRTACGLIGFIIFFLGAFFAFIFAGEAGDDYSLVMGLGCVSLLITFLFFCCVLHMSKQVFAQITPSEGMEMQPFLHQPVPETVPEAEPKTEQAPHWDDKTRHDLKYVRNVLGYPPGDSDETVESGNDSDIEALRNMAISGLPAEDQEGISNTVDDSACIGEESNNIYVPARVTNRRSEVLRIEDSACIGEESNNIYVPARVAYRRSEILESRSDLEPLTSLISLSKSDSAISKSASGGKQKESVSAGMQKLSLEDSTKDSDVVTKQSLSSKQAEKESDAEPGTSKDAKNSNLNKSENEHHLVLYLKKFI